MSSARQISAGIIKGRYTRRSLLLKHAPETRSRVSTPTSTHEGHDEAAEWWNNPIRAWELWKWVRNELWMKKVSQFDWPTGDTSCHGKQISVHTRELPRETDSCNRFALELAPSYQTSLIWGSKTSEQKFCCATYFFARNRWCRRGSFAPGACCRSVLREQAPSCVPTLK